MILHETFQSGVKKVLEEQWTMKMVHESTQGMKSSVKQWTGPLFYMSAKNFYKMAQNIGLHEIQAILNQIDQKS